MESGRLTKSMEYSMQSDPVVSKASELLRLGLMPTPEEVRAGKVGVFFSTLDLCGANEESRICFQLISALRTVFCPALRRKRKKPCRRAIVIVRCILGIVDFFETVSI